MEQKTIGSGQTAKNRMPKTNSLFNGAHSFSDPDHRNNSLASLAPRSDIMRRLSNGRCAPRHMPLWRACAVRFFLRALKSVAAATICARDPAAYSAPKNE